MLFDQISEAVQFIRQRTDMNPTWGIVLGTGLNQLAEAIQDAQAIDYQDIPHFPASTVEGHRGQLIFGQLAGVPVVAMAGRFHYYEGYSLQQVTFPIRVMKALGVGKTVISNAAGSVNPTHEIGDLVFIKDHINLLPDNPLRGPNDERLGPRFPDMLHTYDRDLLEKAMATAKEQGYRAHTGVFAVLSGPNLETPAEYTFLHRIGADLAGMSTVPEVLVARHSGMKIFAVSVVTDLGYPPEAIRFTTHEDVLAAANNAAPKLQFIVEKLISTV
ncbi:MAG: purine-nucleoside phosphorylase [Lewinellaceae bacterium]|nr:purine-nucleoside phosphorylase [Saprospiraceae bacterium]MCB9337280.1 purine-nucleoside phosphorylase [Lewinellaceae bacterium]